ncbi:MAG TPA: hypothetical protein VIL20_07010 [Sandaracinaceae bacterium]
MLLTAFNGEQGEAEFDRCLRDMDASYGGTQPFVQEAVEWATRQLGKHDKKPRGDLRAFLAEQLRPERGGR